MKNLDIKQIDENEILNENDRIVRGWGSVEIRDKDGEIIPIEEFKKIMPVLMKRGGFITDSHTNRIVGKILNYEFKEHPKTKKEGLLITYQIFNDFELDDQVWNEIKQGIRRGLSFGGRSKNQELKISREDFSKEPVKILRELEGYEFASVKEPANPEALNIEVNFLAKGDIKKPFAGYENFDECVRAQMEKGKSEESAKRICGWLKARTEEVEKKALVRDAYNGAVFVGDYVKVLTGDKEGHTGKVISIQRGIAEVLFENGEIGRYRGKDIAFRREGKGDLNKDIYSCFVCGETFTDYDDYKLHMIDEHKKNDKLFSIEKRDEFYVCVECGERFKDYDEYVWHMAKEHDILLAQKKEVNKPDDRRPPKEWWDRCISSVSRNSDVDNPEALCGWIWYHHMKGLDKELDNDEKIKLIKKEVEKQNMEEKKQQEDINAQIISLLNEILQRLGKTNTETTETEEEIEESKKQKPEDVTLPKVVDEKVRTENIEGEKDQIKVIEKIVAEEVKKHLKSVETPRPTIEVKKDEKSLAEEILQKSKEGKAYTWKEINQMVKKDRREALRSALGI